MGMERDQNGGKGERRGLTPLMTRFDEGAVRAWLRGDAKAEATTRRDARVEGHRLVRVLEWNGLWMIRCLGCLCGWDE